MSLDHPYDLDNVFAKIVKGEIPSHKIYEDADILAFMDAFPQTHGHVLVIAKQAQAVNLLDIDAETLTNIILVVRRIAHALKIALSPAGIKLMQFNGGPAGQTVFHLHFHLIPIYNDTTAHGHALEPGDPGTLATLAAQISTMLATLPETL